MDAVFSFLSFWGHGATAFCYAALAIWLVKKYGWTNRQQLFLVLALSLTSLWGFAALDTGPLSAFSLFVETARNLAWLGFIFFLLRSGEGKGQPRTINMIYGVLALVLLIQPAIDLFNISLPPDAAIQEIALHSALLLRMIFAIGALVLVHNLYTISAPDARWGVSLPMAALAAMWTFDLNLYTIAYLTNHLPVELISTRGFATAFLAPIFAMASRRNSAWRIRLSRSVAFQSVSLVVIGTYLAAMVLMATLVQLIGGNYVRLAQITLIFGMSVGALIILPSGQFRSSLNVIIAKNFFKHRYDYRSEWMRFADTIGFPSKEAAPFHERVIKSLADIFESPSGLLLVPDEEARLSLASRWNWPTVDIPANVATSFTVPFFESTGHIVSMDLLRAGTDTRCNPRAIPQWLFEEQRAWAVVPLVHFGKLAGVAVLARPRIKRALDWEDLDMLRVVSRQLASYLAEATSQSALAESQQFEQFNRRFAFVMHDIKNLVSQLSILSRNAEKHGNNPDFQADMVATLQSSVGKMNDMLARLSQHNRGKHAPPIALNMAEALQKSIQNKGMNYPCEMDVTEEYFALADPVRLDTIIGHLIQNAVEASQDNAPIKITCQRQGKDIAIRIADQGCGMSENFIANQLFKPFESTKEGGFGIGAYEARALAISMQGQLRVESRVGKGTCFTLSLPMVDESTASIDFEKAA